MGRRKTPYDPEAVAYAVAEVAKGRGLRDVAAELCELGVPVSHMQVGRWVKEGGAIVSAALATGEPDALPTPPPKTGTPTPPPAVAPALAERLRAQKDRQAGSAEVLPEDDGAAFDFEASLQRMIREAEREAKAHDQASNPRGAQAAMRRASELMKVLAQNEKRKPQDPDVLTFSKAEIEKGYAEVSELLAKLCNDRPVLCSECSRNLSIRWGRGEG